MFSDMRLIVAAVTAAFCLMLCFSSPPAAAASSSDLCQRAIAAAEHASGVPDELLDAISRVETGRFDPAYGALRAWPWTINEEGHGHFYASKSEAVQAAQEFRARGIQSIDVGCTQINLMYHPGAFASLADAFDPVKNAAYAASFLTDLFHQVGSWPHAAAAYHSQTPELGTDYQHKVLAAWAEPIDGPDLSSSASHQLQSNRSEPRQLASTDGSASFPVNTQPLSPVHPVVLSMQSHPALLRPAGGFNGSLSQILHSSSHRFAFTGRTLAAYRAMPVAMLAARSPIAGY